MFSQQIGALVELNAVYQVQVNAWLQENEFQFMTNWKGSTENQNFADLCETMCREQQDTVDFVTWLGSVWSEVLVFLLVSLFCSCV